MAREKRKTPRTRGRKRFFNRETSWLGFNARVLEEAQDPSNPLAERLKFLAIVSGNLDEFFAVRVAGLKQQQAAGPDKADPAGMTPGEQLDAVRAAVRRMAAEQYACFEELRPLVEAAGVRRLHAHDLAPEHRAYLEDLFDREILPTLTPMAVDGERPFPVLGSGQICLGVALTGPDGAEHVAAVPIPKALPRFLYLPAKDGVETVRAEEALRIFLPRLFQGYVVNSTVLFRPTRDADLGVEEEKDEDFAALMGEVLRQRLRSAVVRMEVEHNADPALLAFFKRRMEVKEEDVYPVPGPLDLKALFGLAELSAFNAHRNPTWTPQPVPGLGEDDDLWRTLRSRDVLLHHPYDSFDPVVRLVNEAADDPDVLAVKQVLYRCCGDSKIIRGLERAVQNGKHVSVLVELKARFDENRNIEWARRLEQAGAQVIYGLVGLKTHAKACLVVRREDDGIRRYVHLGTGNYNESTARLYTDFGLMTSDEDLGADVSAFFNTITGYSQPIEWRKIEMAPHGLKKTLIRMIQREADKSAPERPGLVMAKMNSLVDSEVVEALYAAARKGVRVRLNVRGICCLRPGLKSLSPGVEVVSIVDRFLEHSRVFYFHNGGDEEVFLSSADWMPRNLDKRVELMFPVEDPGLKRRVVLALETFFRDNVKARRLLPDGRWERAKPDGDPVRAQEEFMRRACERYKRADEAIRREFRPRKPVR